MRIMNRKEFLALEGQVLFSRYYDGQLGELEIKGGTFGEVDFTCQTIATSLEWAGDGNLHEQLSQAEQSGEDVAMDFDFLGRDGLYVENQLFAVWSTSDTRAFIAKLNQLDGVGD